MNEPRLSRRVGDLKPAETVGTVLKIKQLERDGVDVINFGVGEPDLDTPAHICEAAKRALDGGATRYTDLAGIWPLREAVAKMIRREHGLTVPPEQIIVSSGAKQVLYNLFQALLDDGDEVIVPAPYWTSYRELVTGAGGKLVVVPSTEASGFVPDVERVAAAIGPHTRALLLPTPTNPSGAVFPEPLVRELAALCARAGVIAISDDIYRALSFDGPVPSVAGLAAQAGAQWVIVDGVSKIYRMTGWRIGFGAASARLVKAMAVVQSRSTSCATAVSQAAALAALEGPQECVAEMRAEFSRRRDLVVERIRALDGFTLPKAPGGAFYAFPGVSAWHGARCDDGQRLDDDVALTRFLLEREHVAVNAGSWFGTPGYLRISYATSLAQIEEGFRRIARALATCRRA
jgi:aspartate aminotransferase